MYLDCKTEFSIKKIIIMNLCAGGIKELGAMLQLCVKFKLLWFSVIVRSFLSIYRDLLNSSFVDKYILVILQELTRLS